MIFSYYYKIESCTELLISSEKASTSPVFEENVEILLLTVFNNSRTRAKIGYRDN